MRFLHKFLAFAMLAGVMVFPLSAKAELSQNEQIAIASAVNAAMASGDVTGLKKILAKMAAANPKAAADIVAAACAFIANNNPNGASGSGGGVNAGSVVN